MGTWILASPTPETFVNTRCASSLPLSFPSSITFRVVKYHILLYCGPFLSQKFEIAALLSNAHTVYKADSGLDVFSPSSLTVMALSKIFFLLSFTLHSFLLPTAYASLSKRFQEHSVHEERSALPASWNKRSDTPLDKSRHIPVRINLVQNGIDEHGEDLLMKVSHPDSPHYGKHYTPHEIADLVGLSFFFFLIRIVANAVVA